MGSILRTLLVPALCAAAIVGCDDLPARKGGTSSMSSIGLNDMKNYVGRTIPDRAPVSAFFLDEAAFRVDAFRVGLQSFMRSDAPSLNFNIPAQADYIEILRCREDAKAISGLANIDVGVGSNESETRILRETDFWKNASEASGGCLLVSASVSGNTFLDMSAPSGSYRYLARACVNPSRMTDAEKLGNRNCTKQVVISTPLRSFVNQRAQQEIDALTQMQTAQAKADGLGRRMFFLTADYNNAITYCEKIKASNDKSAKIFSGISMLLGFGVSLGVNLLTASPENRTVDELWDNQNSIAYEGMQVGAVINSLYVNPSNILTECRMAEQVRDEARVTAIELKAAHQLFLTSRTAANQASSARQTLEQ